MVTLWNDIAYEGRIMDNDDLHVTRDSLPVTDIPRDI